MPLIYSFVARGTTVLAAYCTYHGNFETVAIRRLAQETNSDGRFSQSADRHRFHFLASSGFVFLVVADEKDGTVIPGAFLERVRDDFVPGKYAEKGMSAAAHALDKSFEPRLKAQMEYCMQHPELLSKTHAVQKKIDEVKDIMHDNISR